MNNGIEEKSKTQIKNEAEALQELGMELLRLPIQRLKRMALPDDLLNALIEARSITSKIAGKRQRQFIGALMRDVDPEPIRQALLLKANREIFRAWPFQSGAGRGFHCRSFPPDPDHPFCRLLQKCRPSHGHIA